MLAWTDGFFGQHRWFAYDQPGDWTAVERAIDDLRQAGWRCEHCHKSHDPDDQPPLVLVRVRLRTALKTGEWVSGFVH